MKKKISAALFSFQPSRIRASIENLRPRINEYAPMFYSIFFEKYPQTRPLFGRNMSEAELHTRINGFILYIYDNCHSPMKFIPYLISLGTRHRRYGSKTTQFQWAFECHMETMKKMNGQHWDSSYEKEWLYLYRIGSRLMRLGYGRK